MINTILMLLASFGGTVAFALLFSVPSRQYITCGLIGFAGFSVYLMAFNLGGLSAAVSSFFGTAAVCLASRFAAVKRQCPVTIFLICGIFPLIPGGGIYWAAYHAVTGNTQEALSQGFTAVKIVAAMVISIVIFNDVARIIHDSFKKK